MTVQETARKVLELFGPKGERWYQGAWWDTLTSPNPRFCIEGACGIVTGAATFVLDDGWDVPTWDWRGPTYDYAAIKAEIENRVGSHAARFNDSATFAEVKAVLEEIANDDRS